MDCYVLVKNFVATLSGQPASVNAALLRSIGPLSIFLLRDPRIIHAAVFMLPFDRHKG